MPQSFQDTFHAADGAIGFAYTARTNSAAAGRNDLGGCQTPERILFMSSDELPKNRLGKILRRELRTKVDS